MSFMVSETISEMLKTLIKKIQASQRLLGRKCEFRSKKLLWGNYPYKTEEEWALIKETPTRSELRNVFLRYSCFKSFPEEQTKLGETNSCILFSIEFYGFDYCCHRSLGAMFSPVSLFSQDTIWVWI